MNLFLLLSHISTTLFASSLVPSPPLDQWVHKDTLTLRLLQKSIKAVPTVVVYKNGKPVKVFRGDLTMTLPIRLEEVQAVVDENLD